MNTSLLYLNLSEKEKESVFGYFLLKLLKGKNLWEEKHQEVVVYISGLLLNLVAPSSQSAAQKYLVVYESDLSQLLDEAKDLSERYHCLKFNADHLLVNNGIFNPDKRIELQDRIDRGKTYYRMTANCAHHLYRKETPIVQVFDHLSRQFEEYRYRLERLRKTYLHFAQKLTQKEKNELLSTVHNLTLSA